MTSFVLCIDHVQHFGEGDSAPDTLAFIASWCWMDDETDGSDRVKSRRIQSNGREIAKTRTTTMRIIVKTIRAIIIMMKMMKMFRVMIFKNENNETRRHQPPTFPCICKTAWDIERIPRLPSIKIPNEQGTSQTSSC
jgi:hypothetical protein